MWLANHPLQAAQLSISNPPAGARWFQSESNVITWQDTGSSAASYEVRLDRGNGKWVKLGSAGKSAKSFTWRTTGPATESAVISVVALNAKGAQLGTGASGQFQVVLPATSFSGMTWKVRPAGTGGPGPNHWDAHAAWIDSKGFLHLRIFKANGQWKCGEVETMKKLGFGEYRFWVDGRIDRLDKNLVLGLFPYPNADVGPDGTHEIDIEFARWGGNSPIGNYTVWPTSASLHQTTFPFEFTLDGDFTTHVFTWMQKSILFQSLNGHYDDSTNEFSRWLFAPTDAAARVSGAAMPMHINFWLFQGKPPTDGHEAEIVIEKFTFKPA